MQLSLLLAREVDWTTTSSGAASKLEPALPTRSCRCRGTPAVEDDDYSELSRG